MWILFFFIRTLPILIFLFFVGIQTNTFWSWIALNIDSSLCVVKSGGIVPFSVRFESIKHRDFLAHNIEFDVDWVYILTNGRLRFSSVQIQNINLVQKNQLFSPNSISLFISQAFFIKPYIQTFDIGMKGNRLSLNHQNKLSCLFQGHQIQADLAEDDKAFVLSHVLINRWAVSNIKLMPHEFSFYAKDPLHENQNISGNLDLKTLKWFVRGDCEWRIDGNLDEASAHADLTYKNIKASGHYNWVTHIWSVDPIPFMSGFIKVGLDSVGVENIRYNDYQINGSWCYAGTNAGLIETQIQTPFAPLNLKGRYILGSPIEIKTQSDFFGFQIEGTINPLLADIWSSRLQFSIKGKTSITQLLPIKMPHDVIEGDMVCDIKIDGTVMNPRFDGTVRLVNGLYHNVDFGVWLSPIAIALRAKKSNVWNVEEFKAFDRVITRKSNIPSGGLRGSGHITVFPTASQFLNCDMKLILEDLDIAHGDRFQSQASGTLLIQGSEPRITGSVTLTTSDLYLDAIDDGDNIDVVYPGLKKQKSYDKLPLIVPIDIELLAPKRFRIVGSGFDSVWTGKMRAQGYLTYPYLVGEINCLEGKFSVLGALMVIDKSRITYVSDIPNIPQLHIKGTKKQPDGQELFFIVNGSSVRPIVRFESTLGLSQRDIVSLLLFGQKADHISIWQSVQLATAMTKIQKNQRMNWLDQMRNAFGIDVLEVKSVETDTGQTSQALRVGKEIGLMRLSVDAATSTTHGRVVAEARIHPNVSLNADMGGDQSSGFGVDWVKSY